MYNAFLIVSFIAVAAGFATFLWMEIEVRSGRVRSSPPPGPRSPALAIDPPEAPTNIVKVVVRPPARPEPVVRTPAARPVARAVGQVKDPGVVRPEGALAGVETPADGPATVAAEAAAVPEATAVTVGPSPVQDTEGASGSGRPGSRSVVKEVEAIRARLRARTVNREAEGGPAPVVGAPLPKVAVAPLAETTATPSPKVRVKVPVVGGNGTQATPRSQVKPVVPVAPKAETPSVTTPVAPKAETPSVTTPVAPRPAAPVSRPVASPSIERTERSPVTAPPTSAISTPSSLSAEEASPSSRAARGEADVPAPAPLSPPVSEVREVEGKRFVGTPPTIAKVVPLNRQAPHAPLSRRRFAGPADAGDQVEGMGIGPVAPVEDGCTLIGLDIGPSHVAAAASTGACLRVPAIVGYPRDEVARKAIGGTDALVGDSVRRHLHALQVVAPFEDRGAAADGTAEDAAEDVRAVRFLLDEVLGRLGIAPDERFRVVIGVPNGFRAGHRRAIEEALADRAEGLSLVPVPFAVAYGEGVASRAVVIDVGAAQTEVCPITGAFPSAADALALRVGGDDVDRRLFRLLADRVGAANVTMPLVRRIKEEFGFVGTPHRRANATLYVDGRPRTFDLTDDVGRACQGLVAPLVRAVEQVIGAADPEFQARLASAIVLTGGAAQVAGLDRVLEKELAHLAGEGDGRVQIRRVEEPGLAVAVGALAVARDFPPARGKNAA